MQFGCMSLTIAIVCFVLFLVVLRLERIYYEMHRDQYLEAFEEDEFEYTEEDIEEEE